MVLLRNHGNVLIKSVVTIVTSTLLRPLLLFFLPVRGVKPPSSEIVPGVVTPDCREMVGGARGLGTMLLIGGSSTLSLGLG